MRDKFEKTIINLHAKAAAGDAVNGTISLVDITMNYLCEFMISREMIYIVAEIIGEEEMAQLKQTIELTMSYKQSETVRYNFNRLSLYYDSRNGLEKQDPKHSIKAKFHA